ncbi:MAG: Hsp70 family protein [Defluviitaleaceae bacterium]|nr:Hsp70 family protein [Defluviitaleaceae bacterium]
MTMLELEESSEEMLGIDFGTTNSVVSFFHEGKPHIIQIDGMNVTPTVVQFEEDYEDNTKLSQIFGTLAKEAAIIYPESTVLSVKRYLGSGKKIKIVINEKEVELTPEQIAAEILAYLKKSAEEYALEELGTNINFSGTVITVPANSTDKQKKMTKAAAILAGFDEEKIHLRLEPVAAAISYAVNETSDKKVLIYDFGGGTFDACVLSIEMKDSIPEISVQAAYGDNDLGGNDIDLLVMDIIYEEFKKQAPNIDLFDLESEDGLSKINKKIAIARLMQMARQAKERLSDVKNTKITMVPFIQEPEIININFELSRETFISHKRKYLLNDSSDNFERYKGKNLLDMMDETIKCIESCLEMAMLEPKDIDEIILVGGSSSLWLITDIIKAKFNKIPYKSISPALAISYGASVYTNILNSQKSHVGPIIKEKTIHPLGIEIAGRIFAEIVPAGVEIPEEGIMIESEETFYTNFDDVSSMVISVYEDKKPQANKSVNREGMKRLGGTTLHGIPKASKGAEKVKVTFAVNRDNMLKVYAVSEGKEGISTELSVDELY